MKVIPLLGLFCMILTQVSALSVNLSCPQEVTFNEEFECSISVIDNTENYDVKLDFFGDGKRISRIFNNEEWKSSNYYLISFINSDIKDIKIVINNFSGEVNGVLKLRKTGKTSVSYQENVSLVVKETEEEVNEKIDVRSEKEKKIDLEGNIQKDFEEDNSQTINKSTERIIKLNTDEQDKKVIYISHNEKIRENIFIIFSIFLILIIIFLVITK